MLQYQVRIILDDVTKPYCTNTTHITSRYYLRKSLVESNTRRTKKSLNRFPSPLTQVLNIDGSVMNQTSHRYKRYIFLYFWLLKFHQRPTTVGYRDLFRDVLVHLASVKYIFYVSISVFMTCVRSVKEHLFISLVLIIIHLHKFSRFRITL